MEFFGLVKFIRAARPLRFCALGRPDPAAGSVEFGEFVEFGAAEFLELAELVEFVERFRWAPLSTAPKKVRAGF